MNYFWSRKYRVKCPDGSTKTVYRNVDKALPVYIGVADREFKANAKVLDHVDGEISANSKSKISGMLYSLDNFNNTIQMEFRAIYLVYESDPCSNNEIFTNKMTELVEKYQALNSTLLDKCPFEPLS